MSDRLRILHVASHEGITSGGSIQLARAAMGQRRRGHEVSSVFHRRGLSPRQVHPSLSALAEAGVRIRTIRMRGIQASLAPWRLRRVLAAERPDVVHIHRDRGLRLVLSSADRSPSFALVAQRGNSNRLSPENLARLLDPRIDRLVAVARAVRDGLVRDGVPGERIRVIYGSVDVDRFHPDVDGRPFRDELGISDDTPLVGIVANLDPKKSHGAFLDAAVLVHRERPAVRFVVIGGGNVEAVRAEAVARGLGNAVAFPGFREDVPAGLAALDVSVCASARSEGLTGALRESLAMSRPVVSTRVGGNDELVRDGETGVLVEPGDPAALAGGILWTLAHREAAGTRARRGRDLVVREMTDDVRLDRLDEVYREILAAKR